MEAIPSDQFSTFATSINSSLLNDGVISAVLAVAVVIMTVKVVQLGAYKVLGMIDDYQQRKADEHAWYMHDNRE